LSLPALCVGAHGAIGLTFNFMPTVYVEIYQAFSAGDLETARELQYKANRVIPIVLEYGAGGLAAIKPIMRTIGFECGSVRGPLPRLDQSAIERMHRQLTEVGFFSDPIYTAWAKGRSSEMNGQSQLPSMQQ